MWRISEWFPCRIQAEMRVWRDAVWFVGAGVWLLVAALSLRFHAPGRTLGAMVVAVLFFAAGMFFSRAGVRQPPGKR